MDTIIRNQPSPYCIVRSLCVCVYVPAFCKNPLSNRWYSFNDETVSELNGDSAVVTNAAYLLFYRRHYARSDRCKVSLSRWIEAILSAAYNDLEVIDSYTPKKSVDGNR